MEVRKMTYEELMALTKDVEPENRYIPLKDTPPHCLLPDSSQSTHSILGSKVTSNVLGKSRPDWFWDAIMREKAKDDEEGR